MSDGHARTAGRLAEEITVGGRTYRLRPIITGLYAELEAYVAAQRGNPLALATEACKMAPPEQHDAIWQAAMSQASKARVVTAAEIAEFERSIRGLAWKLWACLQAEHAAEFPRPDDALRLIEEAGEQRMAEVASKVHVASGEADLGNSDGPGPSQDLGEKAA